MILSQDLTLRYNANVLFDKIESLTEDCITIDFINVRTMTRSFAQEYLSRKLKTSISIVEVNMSNNNRKMFSVAYSVFKKSRFLETERVVTFDIEQITD